MYGQACAWQECRLRIVAGMQLIRAMPGAIAEEYVIDPHPEDTLEIVCFAVFDFEYAIRRRSLASMRPRHTIHPEHTPKIAPAFSGYHPSMDIKRRVIDPPITRLLRL